MATAVSQSGRPMISSEFLAEQRRRRIALAFAELVVSKGYRETTVADIVSQARTARNTFYETFPSKAGVAAYLVGRDFSGSSADILAVDIAALYRIGDEVAGDAAVSGARAMLRSAAAISLPPLEPDDGAEDPVRAKLPPGRHGLPLDFVAKNQRHRLLVGVAKSVCLNGRAGATVANVTAEAAVSRRTFYEHFKSVGDGVDDMLVFVETKHAVPSWTAAEDPSGFGSVWAEVIAAKLCGDHALAAKRCAQAEYAVNAVDPAARGRDGG